MEVILLFYLCLCIPLYLADVVKPPQNHKCKESGNELEKTCQYDESTMVDDTCFCDFEVDEGYQIEVIVKELDLNGDTGDIISIGTDKYPDEYRFSWFLKEEKRFLILGETAYVKFKTNSLKSPRTFTITMKRFGELTTTAKPPSTPIEWPEPGENDTIFHTVNIATNKGDFVKKLKTFRIIMANITQDYCEKHNIAIIENVTEQNIVLHLAIECPITWPQNDNCIQLRFAIPVFLQNGTHPAYQLQTPHLKLIWAEFVNTKLNELGWSLYEAPNDSDAMFIWLGISLTILVLFAVLLFGIRKLGFKLKNRIKRRSSDTENIMKDQITISDASLYPRNQVVPPIFGENQYTLFEPELNTAMKPPQMSNHTSTSKMIDMDDLSDEDIMYESTSIAQERSAKITSVILDDAHAYESAL